MQLRRIKLAGFKSFVDPTIFHLPSGLVGIVGPNGCGKSNFIDAVRWVMGESSAKHLRGESIADVIFNGSSARKAAEQASVELIFENSEGRVSGSHALDPEILVRRVVHRDGQSTYFLNNVRCRRKDITDVFLGTGFGPRSYSIIEQGMISRLVEAHPEDLRAFLEEAAGISKYRERRKETEPRLAETRENLSRLDDILRELKQQLTRLAKQSEAALRYQSLQSEEKTTRNQLLVLRWRTLDQQRQKESEKIEVQTQIWNDQVAKLKQVEKEEFFAQEEAQAASEFFSKAQERFYSTGAGVSKIEQILQHAREEQKRQSAELNRIRASLTQAESQRATDQEETQKLSNDLLVQKQTLASAENLVLETEQQLSESEQAYSDCQSRWEETQRAGQIPVQTAQIERTRLTHLEQQQVQLVRRRERLEQELSLLESSPLQEEVRRLEESFQAGNVLQESFQSALVSANQAIVLERSVNQQKTAKLEKMRDQLHTFRGRLASLEILQQSALGKGKGVISEWLAERGLDQAVRLAEKLEVASGWERAVEVVLGPYLEAVCVEDLAQLVQSVGEIKQGSLILWSQEGNHASVE
ncbi:hypothetical protein CCP3SC1AL1_40028 [Gammaproteobacteria bacterium]